MSETKGTSGIVWNFFLTFIGILCLASAFVYNNAKAKREVNMSVVLYFIVFFRGE